VGIRGVHSRRKPASYLYTLDKGGIIEERVTEGVLPPKESHVTQRRPSDSPTEICVEETFTLKGRDDLYRFSSIPPSVGRGEAKFCFPAGIAFEVERHGKWLIIALVA